MLEVRTATYRPGIDQSQHVKSVILIIKNIICEILPIRAAVIVKYMYMLLACVLKLHHY